MYFLGLRKFPQRKGIGRNCRYIFDLTIRRKGTSDPDIPVRHEDIVTTLEITPWEEIQEDYIKF